MERTVSERKLLAESSSYEQELSTQAAAASSAHRQQTGARRPVETGSASARLQSISGVLAQQRSGVAPSAPQPPTAAPSVDTIDQMLGVRAPATNAGLTQPTSAAMDYLNLPPYQMQQSQPQQPSRPARAFGGRGFAAKMNKGSFRKLVEKVMSGDEPDPYGQPPPPPIRRRPKPEINDLRDKSGCKMSIS